MKAGAGSLAVTAAVVSWPQAREAFGVGVPSLESVDLALAAAVAATVLSELVKSPCGGEKLKPES